jgi:uncharacterized membrane protein HdeD (DUF308 family)
MNGRSPVAGSDKTQKWCIGLGILLALLGASALIGLWLYRFSSVLFVGWVLITAGAIEISAALLEWNWRRLFVHLFPGLLYIGTGVPLLIGDAGRSTFLATILLARLFLTVGVFRIITTIVLRHTSAYWAGLDGVVTLGLALLIRTDLFSSELRVIGLFIGVGLIHRGWAWITFAIVGRKLARMPDALGQNEKQLKRDEERVIVLNSRLTATSAGRGSANVHRGGTVRAFKLIRGTKPDW